MTRWRCCSCGAITAEPDQLTAPNPFDPRDTLTGCPHCLAIPAWERICDEPGCDRSVCAGTPTDHGYQWNCSKHRPHQDPFEYV